MTIFGNETARRAIEPCLQAESRLRTILLTGPDHLGKRSFAEEALLARSGEEDLFRTESGVDSMREAVRFAASATAYGSFKSVLVDQVDGVSDAAQDALLKLCEEPPGDLRVVLVTADEGQVPPALLSRVRKMVRWAPLPWPEMLEFGASVGADETSLRMCYGRPGLWTAVSTSPGLLGLHEAVTRAGEYDPATAPVPEAIKGLKSGPSDARDAVCVVLKEAARALAADPARRSRAVPFLRLASTLARVPSVNAELHWSRACLEGSM